MTTTETMIRPETLSPAEIEAYAQRFTTALGTCVGAVRQGIERVVAWNVSGEGEEPEVYATETALALAVVEAMVSIMRDQAYNLRHPYDCEGEAETAEAWPQRYVAVALSTAAEASGEATRAKVEAEGIGGL